MITIQNDTFLIDTKHTSYLFTVDAHRHLEHIHYGPRVSLSDTDALRPKRRAAYGTTVLYDEEDDVYCLDSVLSEYGTYGRGDFREASIELEHRGSYTIDFLYDSYTLVEGDIPIEGLPSSYGCEKTLILHLKDKDKAICLDLYYSVYSEEDVISRRAVLINKTEEDILLHKMLSYSLDLAEEDLILLDLHGAWDKEAHIQERDILPGTITLSSRVGFSSAKNNPAFLVKKKNTDEEHGDAWGFNLVWSGDHYSSISRDEYGFCRIQGGIGQERFHYTVAPGSSFSTPEAVLTFSDQGLNTLSHHFHDFIREHIVRSNWKKRERPVLINSWEGFGFDFTKDGLLELADEAADLGMELFVLDDGWFGRRNDDTKGLGDYDPNLEKLPGGIKSLSEEIHKRGLSFGIWVEPEAVSADSVLYEQHPDYALKEEGRDPVLGRHEYLMDLTNSEVRSYIVKQVSSLIDDNNVNYVKWDMNRHHCGISGAYDYEYIKGLYEVMDRIFTPRPDILLESCASGGNRFDLGVLCYSPQIWTSDDTDPIERLDIQKGMSYFYPQSVMGAHVSTAPHSQTYRITPLETRFTVAAYGCLGYELDLTKLTAFEKEEIKKQISFYKDHRSLFQFGTFSRLSQKKEEEVFEVSEGDEAIVSKIRRLYHSAPGLEKLQVRVLDPDKVYEITSREYRIDLFSSDGIDAAKQHYISSGSALKHGIVLDDLFLGTGRNEHLRLPLDYGSDMYLIKEKKD